MLQPHRLPLRTTLAGLLVLSTFHHAAADDAPNKSTVVVDYATGRSTFRGTEGVFFDPNDEPTESFIRAEIKTLGPPNRRPQGFLSLQYVVESVGKFNGHWWKYKVPQDWSRHVDDKLVFRVAKGEVCTPRFKIEVKSAVRPKGPQTVFGGYVWLGDEEHSRQITRDGYTEITIPLSDLKADADFVEGKLFQPTLASRPFVHEVVVIFENSRIEESSRTGELLLGSISLTSADAPAPRGGSRMEQLERKAYDYFVEQAHPRTHFVRDRAGNLPGAPPDNAMSSIAATGYLLSILPDAVERGWTTRAEAVAKSRRILEFAATIPHQHGLFYHFVHWETGKPWGRAEDGSLSEISCLDSAIFLNGAATVSIAFPEVSLLANRLIARAEWNRFLVKTKGGKTFLALGSKQGRLIGRIDVRTSESAMSLLLAIGSGKVPVSCWYDTMTDTREIAGTPVAMGHLPLFVHYYGLGWAELEGLVDRQEFDLHENARLAALSNRRYCLEKVSRRHTTFTMENGGFWALSAGDSEEGYVAVGPVFGSSDGTTWPVAALGTIRWIPEILERDLDQWAKSKAYDSINGRYGLAPFNLTTGWRGKQIIAIDVGAFLVNAINQRDKGVSRYWMKHPVASRAIETIGFAKRPVSASED